MNKVERYTTFDDLKTSVNKTSNHSLLIVKHTIFEKVIKQIESFKKGNFKKISKN